MDMKKMPKPRMDDYEYERKQRREREKSERQQVQSATSNREVALFAEPRRVNPSEDDDKISAKLGDYSKARDFINLYTVGISNSGLRQMPANAVLPGIVPTSSPLPNVNTGLTVSSSAAGPPSSIAQRLLPPPLPQAQQSQQPPHHYQQQQQQLRQAPYVKQADNKPPYNGRGGYPGQPVNRLSSGMAPPKGPPAASLLPPNTSHLPNGRQTSSAANTVEKSYLGPPIAPSSSSANHNGRFSQPSIPKQRQKPLPPENDITEIINHVTNTFCPPKMLTGIDATPHNTLMENYNLSEKNKHKYSFDILAKTSIVEPLDSPPRMQMAAPKFVPPLSAAITTTTTTPMPSLKSACNNSAPTSSSTYIAPSVSTTSSAGHFNSSTSSSSAQSSSLVSNTAITSPTVPHSPVLSRPIKEIVTKPLKTEKPTPPPIEKQNSTLENDLELSDSDDDRKKQNRSTVNSSDSSPSDSSESGSDSSRSERQQQQKQTVKIPAPQQIINHQLTAALSTKKKLGPGSSSSIAGGSNSSGLGSSAPPSGGSSSSSSNKTPSPSNTTKWQLSRYFNKVPLHQTPTQDVVSPSATSMVNSVNTMNVANLNMPITLRGGAQIIPEPPQHVANIKNESLIEDVDEGGEDDGNDIEDETSRKRNRGSTKNETFPHPAFSSRKAPAGLSVTPLSPILNDIKKEIATSHMSAGVNQQQVPSLNSSEFVSIPSTHIKCEAMSIAGGHTTVTPYAGDVIEGLSNLSSDTNSSDDERLPVRGPGGTLKIRGVPAAITALPRSPPVSQKTQMLNSVTMICLDNLGSSPTGQLVRAPPQQSRPKKPRKKLKQQTSATVATDTSDEEPDDLTKRLISPVTTISLGGTTNVVATGPKKGRGRPRKTTTNQSVNIMSSTSSAAASAKGPSLTAKKDINKKPATVSSSAIVTARRRASRLNSSNCLAQDLTTIATAKQHLQAPVELIQGIQLITPVSDKEQLSVNATSDDSSSSSESSTCSVSKSSSSGSDTDIDAKINKKALITKSSSSEDEGNRNENRVSKTTTGVVEQKSIPPKRIVKKLNTRKSSVDDLTASVTTPNNPRNISMSSTSSSSSSESSVEDFGHLPNASTLTGGSSQQVATTVTGGSSSHRSVNHQSPHKVASAFFSESSGEEHSDSDSGDTQKEKKLKRDKPKSDKNKISTLTRIFKSSNEGGAKKQGQVVIIDQSEDQQQMHQQQKHISPTLRLSQENLSAIQNSLQNTPTSQSPRLTPGSHARSPRSLNITPLTAQVLAPGITAASHHTPDRISTSAERKLHQRIKTPTRTPTRTPPTTRTPTPIPAVAAAVATHHPNTSSLQSSGNAIQQHLLLLQPPPPPSSLICKIDLSRLLNVPMEWHANTYRLYGHAPGHQQNHLTPCAGRTPIYDHESILNADLQSCNNQMRLKSASSSHFSGGSSGSATPRSTGNRTPIQIASTISSASERELSHSRENLNDLAKENGNTGRLSSRSTDGSVCGGGSSPKEQLQPPNGYSSVTSVVRVYNSPNSTSLKLLTGVKHEQIIKHDPDSEYACNEPKFKSESSSNPTTIKQEILILKQDYKPPNDLTEKSSLCSPNDLALEPKMRRKRSSSSSSSPYKEKKRKKEKELGACTLTEKDKIIVCNSEISNEKKDAVDDCLQTTREITAKIDSLTNLSDQHNKQKDQQILLQQFSPTNHDRLIMDKKLQQQKSTDNNSSNNKLTHIALNTASPTITNNHSTAIVSTNMPPPANVGLIPTISQPPPLPMDIVPMHSAASASSTSSISTAASTSGTTSGNTQTHIIYRSYFERDDDALSEEISKDGKFLQEAVHRKHAADREQDTFKQVTLYLEAVVYFLLSGAAMEQHSRSEDAAWTMYKDTLTLIKFISSKFKYLQVSSANQHETHNKVAILSLRCQSLIALKLYKLKRNYCRQINTICSEFFKPGKSDITNGNTPSSISPSNSVGSQGSGSNTPPGRIVPQDIHSALYQQCQYFTYLSSSHELWDQADRLVRQGNHTEFFIALDHENGPLTLHSNVYEVFRYVHAGLKKLKEEMLIQ